MDSYFYPSEGSVEAYSTSSENLKFVLQDYAKTVAVATGLIPVEFPPFQDFQKIPRLFRDCVVTEKIDGTNASVVITEDGQIRAGSRTRYIYPNKPKAEGQKRAEVTDNYGFAAWVEAHKEELLRLGKGRHFGEWYGKGINRNYGIEEKRFALFNTSVDRAILPNCVGVVPVLYTGPFDLVAIREVMDGLRKNGSVAVPGWLKPEGVVVFHVAAGKLFKATLESDGKPKGVTG